MCVCVHFSFRTTVYACLFALFLGLFNSHSSFGLNKTTPSTYSLIKTEETVPEKKRDRIIPRTNQSTSSRFSTFCLNPLPSSLLERNHDFCKFLIISQKSGPHLHAPAIQTQQRTLTACIIMRELRPLPSLRGRKRVVPRLSPPPCVQ